MQILALANQKGGCGKTTVAINLASALAKRDERVLLVDLDPQAHATLGLGQADFAGTSIADVFVHGKSIAAVSRPLGDGFHLVPGSLALAEFEEVAGRTIGPERILEQALEEVAPLYDWVLIDCPTRADGILAANAIRAATLVVLVVETGAFALQGAIRARRLFLELARELGRTIEMRVLATLFDPDRAMAREILIGIHGRFGEEMFDTVILTAEELFEATAFGVTVEAFAPNSAPARRFRALAAELSAFAAQRDGGPRQAAGSAAFRGLAVPLPPLSEGL